MNARSRAALSSLLTYEEAMASGAIEVGIQPLVKQLNSTGCTTIASCEGHGRAASIFRRGYIEKLPFVLFHATIERARLMDDRLGYGHGTSNQLKYYWKLQGHFYPDDRELVWTIEMRDIRMLEEFDRSALNRDIQALSTLVNDGEA